MGEQPPVQLVVTLPALAALALSSALAAALATFALFKCNSLKTVGHKDEDADEQALHQREEHTASQRGLMTPQAKTSSRHARGAGSQVAKEPAQVSTPLLQHQMPASSLFSPLNLKRRLDPCDPSPRTGYLSWDDYFMSVAFLSAERSKDPNKQVGAVIVNSQKVILGIGYNGFPRGCADGTLPWSKKAPGGVDNPLETKYPYVVHAEANALLNKNSASVDGATIYVTMFPCNECAKLLIQAGIQEVVFHEDKVQHYLGDKEAKSLDKAFRNARDTRAGPRMDASNSSSGHTSGNCDAAAAVGSTPCKGCCGNGSTSCSVSADDANGGSTASVDQQLEQQQQQQQQQQAVGKGSGLTGGVWNPHIPRKPAPQQARSNRPSASGNGCCSVESAEMVHSHGSALDSSCSMQLSNGCAAATRECSSTGTSGTGDADVLQRAPVTFAAAAAAANAVTDIDHCYIASKRLLSLAGIRLRQHKLQRAIHIPV